MEQYNVTGMSCAACSARVEKAVSKVPGVTSCSVSLLTNSMGVEGTADEAAVIAAVEAAGYGASVKGAAKSGGSGAAAPPPGRYKLRELLERTEQEAIESALRSCGNNRSKAMDLLGISRRNFYQKLEKYHLN